jgi:hypothetical protein
LRRASGQPVGQVLLAVHKETEKEWAVKIIDKYKTFM